MPKLPISLTQIPDPTGYLFSFAKSLAAVLHASPWAKKASQSIATSGFAFRIWIDRATLCPSATSIWSFASQKAWVENGGFTCDYTERLWGQDNLEEERRMAAIHQIRRAVDGGLGAVAWDISGCEWGVVTGYDDNTETLYTAKLNGGEGTVPYGSLGKLDLPILSVLTVTGATDKPDEQIYADTKKLAAAHLRGEEWCDNAKGLEAFDALVHCVRTLPADSAWNVAYNIGTYCALRMYARDYLRACADKGYGAPALAALYEKSYAAWTEAWDALQNGNFAEAETREKVVQALTIAKEAEAAALVLLEA